MKIAMINMVDFGSTGRIMQQIADMAKMEGHTVRTYSKKWRKQINPSLDHIYYGFTLENIIHVVLSKSIGFQGLFSYFGTKQLISDLKRFNPDVVHLHNLHDSSTSISTLFKYLGEIDVPVVWTLHDCWPFTGQCPHFVVEKCDKWKSGCGNCEFLSNRFKIDCTSYMWKLKKRSVDRIKKLTIVTPSKWLETVVGDSFFNNRNVRLINNGIDLKEFKYTIGDFGKMYNLYSKKIILAVASSWTKRKGLFDLIEMDRKINHDIYQVIVVGSNDDIDTVLPNSIISIHRTSDTKELAEIYSFADVFINPTYEDTFPTTNIEALACGTPVITYDTGGSSEILNNECGYVVKCGDINQLIEKINLICSTEKDYQFICRERAEQYDKNRHYIQYIKLYEELFSKEKQL